MWNHPQKLRSWFWGESKFWLLIICPSLCTMHQGVPLPLKTPGLVFFQQIYVSVSIEHIHKCTFSIAKCTCLEPFPMALYHDPGMLVPLCHSHQWNGKGASLPTQTSINAAWKTLTGQDGLKELFVSQAESVNICKSSVKPRHFICQCPWACSSLERIWNAGSGTRRIAAGWKFVRNGIS